MAGETTAVTQKKADKTDLDSPWKYALEYYFRDFMEYCLPHIAAKIDWNKQIEFLDKELQTITRNANIGRRIADKLIKVWRNNFDGCGLLHQEVQAGQEKFFPERMLIYHYRIRDRYNIPLTNIAILIDDNPNWRPDHYQESHWGSSLTIHYLVIKLLDFRSKQQELAQSHNRFAIIILAQLAVLETQNQPLVRLQTKITLTCKLYEKNWGRQDILQLYTLIDWIITLPEELVLQYNNEIKQIEEERKVNYITTAERLGRQEGLQEGFQQGLLKGESMLLTRLLKLRFKHLPNRYLALIQQADNETLLLWSERILYAGTLQEIFN